MPVPPDNEGRVDARPATLQADILITDKRGTRRGTIAAADWPDFHEKVAAMNHQIAAINTRAEHPYTLLVHTPQPIP
ncbi:hypothetical protein A2973_00310 [Candidatus Gottesmanbacteria bacterium RIFCSPLOWO2_01_FULL_49_10]|uniref:Uncharacterized protein n=1 Tax=Candidatus Gottesmanbacteria bacterium RIFCSPLOWO2_01_FULL_49_10 TaxID=1798396 RepID=A0A1F6AYD4_9BACT|nr:MAG: hypothetical protein A2973_00310 [Candidatus Gottesmanbacteria bacterium RIFCSPLOWO2_01_FULL_49_10]